MKKFFLGLVVTLIFALSVFAEVEIPKEKRVKNFPSGCCVWCAVENLGNIHGITELNGIAKYRHDNYSKVQVWVEGGYFVDENGNLFQSQGYWTEVNQAPGSPERVKQEFDRLGINYKLQFHGIYDTEILKEAVDKNLGCAVGVKDYPAEGNYHMITLTDLDDKKFVFIENNYDLPRIEKTREWFNEHWTGFTVLVYPPLEEIKPAPRLEKD